MNSSGPYSPPYPNLIWLLRAFAQDAETQLYLYSGTADVTDDMATDFDSVLICERDDFLEQNPEIMALANLLERQPGKAEYWTNIALKQDPYLEEIRATAREICRKRCLSLAAPELLAIAVNYVDE